MRLFSKDKVASVGKDKLAKGIAGFILKMNIGFARYMSRCTAKLSSSTIQVAVIVFLSFGTSVSVYFMVAAFVNEEPSKSIKIDRISIPRNFNNNGDDNVQRSFMITKEEYEEMKRYSKYMDSLQGSKRYDSIVAARPGLLDSIKLLETMYEQNKRK